MSAIPIHGEPADALLAFTRGLRARHARAAAIAAGTRALLAVAVPAIAIVWFVPAVRVPVLALVVAFTAVSASFAALRARRVAARALLGAADAASVADPRALAELQDEFATWLEGERTASPMRAWLTRDVHARIGALPPATVAAVGRRRVGRVLWLLPIVVLLLIAWFLTDWLSPPWAGVLGGRAALPSGGQGEGDGQQSGGGGGGEPQSEEPVPSPNDPSQQPQPDAPQPPPAAEEPPPPEPKPEEPAPLLDLPPQQRFVVPEFIGDGPTRRVRMHAAAVDEPDGGAARTEQRGDAPANAAPPPTKTDFERAAEAALRARNVPPAEQPIVRRYFDALREAAK